MWKKVCGLGGVFVQPLFVWPPPLQKISALQRSESSSWFYRVGADIHLTRGSLWTPSLPKKKKRIGERNWKPPKNLWSRLMLWKQSSMAASCLMNRNDWHSFFSFINMKSTKTCLCFLREREKGADIDRLASFRSFSPLHLLSPASSCLSNRNWFQLSVLKVVSIPKMHLEDRGETGRSGGATSIPLPFSELKTALLKRLFPSQLARQTRRVRQNNLKLYSVLCCCCSDCVPRRLLKSELKVNKTRSSCA